MGGLSSGPGPGLCLLTLVVLIVAQQVESAPVQEDNLSQQSRAQGYYDGSSSELSTGCYYNFQHYGEGDRIITNEPCLNCTCHNRMLMCYLRVCPFTKAIGQNCTIEKKPGQCCPLIICPEVPVQLLTSSTTTEHSESLPHRNQIGYGQYGTAVGHLDDYGCKINGEFYTNGAQIPGNIDKPCEVCYCIRNRTACIMQECTLQVEGCIPVYEEGLCCPVRYQCDYEYNYNAITTEQPRPTPGLVLTTTTSGPFECQHDNKWYADGAMVDTEDSCEHCYCMKGDIVCAVQECRPPFEKDGHNCTAMPPAPGKCCPDSYHCDGNEIVDESEPTFRQDRMHKFGQNNANITMSITSSTSSGDKQHSWHYGTSSNENEMPNRFTDEQNKDGTTKPGKPSSDSDMMVTEGVPPTSGPLESGSHHVDGHGGGSGMRPMESHTGMRPMEGQSSTGQGHGVSTDNMLTISQVIQSIVQNQTNLFNQNKFNQTGKPEKRPTQHDDKVVFPIDVNLEKKPGMEFQTDEDGNPIEAHSGATDFQNEYYDFIGNSPNIYSEHGGRPQKKPGNAGTQTSPGHTAFGENQNVGGHKRPGMSHDTSGGDHGMTQHAQKKPVVHQHPGMAGTLVLTDDEGNPIEIYEGVTGEPEGNVYSSYDKYGRPQRPGMQGGATGVYGGAQEGFTGSPGSDNLYSTFDEYGKPQRRPVIHKQPAGVGGEGENVMGSQDLTGRPGLTNQPETFGEHGHVGRPHKKPITHKKPVTTDDEMVTETYEDISGSSIFAGKPVTDEHGRPLIRPGSEIMTDEDNGFHGKPQKRPGTHKQPGGQMSEDDVTGGYEIVTETAEDFTDLPDIQTVHGETGLTGRPNIHEKPSSSGSSVLTDEHGKPVTDSNIKDGIYIYYDKYGKPYKRPIVHKPAGVGGIKGEEHLDGTTELPESLTQEISSQDEHNTPYKKPQIHTKPITPENDFTEEDGNPIEEIKGTPEEHNFEIFYDKYGRPHKRPATHKTPITGGITNINRDPIDGVPGITGKPGSISEDQNELIYYDQYGRPHKRPVTHTQPVQGVMTSEDGVPVGDINSETDFPETFTGKPGTDGEQIFYDHYGRPHKKPVTHKKPGQGVNTDEHGMPLEGVEGVTDYPQSLTGTQGIHGEQIFYDQHGRPHKRPIAHKPGQGIMTDGDGKPIDGVEGVSDFPEGSTGKPDTDDQQIFFDEHGRPYKRPVSHKPGQGVMTDEDGNPIDELEGVTDLPEGSTGKPGTDDQQIFYDEHGRPYKKPIAHKPGQGIMTDEDGKPIDGVDHVTDFPSRVTEKPGSQDQDIFYDEHGRPHKKPVTHKKPGEGVVTDEDGRPIDGVEGVTGFPEGSTGKPGSDDQQIFYDEHGRPYKRPVSHKPGQGVTTDENGKPIDGVEGVSDFPEGSTGKPGTDDQQIFFDEHGRPYKRPVSHKPGQGVMTDEDGKPTDGVEGVTGFPEGSTGKPGSDDQQIFYDQHGRPHKRPIAHRPGQGVTTDEDGKPIDGVGVTDLPVGSTGKPSADDQQIFFDEHGRPYKRPVSHKPGEGVMTDDDGKPIDGVDDITDFPQRVTDKPGTQDQGIFYDQHGRPHKKPVTHKKPGEGVMTGEDGKPIDGVEGLTDLPEGSTERPSTDDQQIFYDQHGRPHKRPIAHRPGQGVTTDEDGNLIDGVGSTDLPEGSTGKPGTDDQQIFYDEHGRPHKKPIAHKPGQGVTTDEHGKPIEEVEGVTDFPPRVTEKPGTQDQGIFYDQHGRPHKKPVTDKKPGEGVVTDEDDKPIDGVGSTDFSEGSTERPSTDDQQIFYDEHGRPYKKPIAHKPGQGVTTDEDGKPIDGVEGVTDFPPRVTEKPGSQDQEIFYDDHGRPLKKPVTHKKPGSNEGDVLPDEHGTPIDGVTKSPEGDMDDPEHDGITETMMGYGHTGIPDIKPGQFITGPEGVNVVTGEVVSATGDDDVLKGPSEHTTSKPISHHDFADYGKPGTTERPYTRPDTENKPGSEVEGITAEDVEMESNADVFDSGSRPIYDGNKGTAEKPGSQSEPGENVMTDKKEQPVKPMTEFPGHSVRPGATGNEEVLVDQYGRPQMKPVVHSTTEENVKPGDQFEIMTEIPEGLTHKPESDSQLLFYDQFGRPHTRPVTHKKPGEGVMTDEDGNPIDGVDDITDFPQRVTDKPGTQDQGIFYDQHGRPHKKPVTHKKPGEGVVTDEDGRPIDGVEGVSDFPEGSTGKPGTDDQQIFFDEHGRPYKRPVSHKPGQGVMTDEDGKPIDGVEGVTDFPEGSTGKPGSDDQQIFYDEHGRPYKKPVTHKPGQEVMTDEDGKPIDGVDDVTDFPSRVTEKPGSQDQDIFYDEHGRPHKKPVTHKKPGEGVVTDEDGRPIDGVEGVTGFPEGSTGKPGSDDQQIFYDEHGRPYKKPVTHKPGQEVMTDEDGKPIDGVDDITDFPQRVTDKPGSQDQDIFYDEHGRPHKKPVTHKKPGEGVVTDEDGRPIDGVEGVTGFPEGSTGKPGSDDQQIFYDEHGRPHKRPVIHGVPEENLLNNEHGLPQGVPQQGQIQDSADDDHVGLSHLPTSGTKVPTMDFSTSLPDEDESITKHPTEGIYDEPGVQENFFGETGRPMKKPVLPAGQYHPGTAVAEEDPVHTQSTAASTESGEEIFHDEHGQLHKKPVTDKHPGLTDENEIPIAGVTKEPDIQITKPEGDNMEIFYDKYGKPHKRPVSHVKPTLEGTQILTDENDQQPVEKDATETPEEQAALLETDKTDESAQKEKKPEGQMKPDSDEADENQQPFEEQSPDEKKEKPGNDTTLPGHDQDRLPQKRPGSYTKPGTEEQMEKEPDLEKAPQTYGEHEHTDSPQEKPVTEKGGSPADITTELPETQTSEMNIVYDKYGRPHKRPITDKNPEFIPTGEDTQPDNRPEGITDITQDFTAKPESGEQQIFYDEHGRPHKKPIAHKPGQGVMTDEDGKPIDGVDDITDFPQRVTDKPGTQDQGIFYDQHGRPHKKPVIHKKPGEGVITDEDGNPIDGVEGVTDLPVGSTGKPSADDQQIFFDEHGRPYKKPIAHKPGQGVTTDEDGKPIDGLEGVTDLPEGSTGKPGTDDQQIFYDEHGRPYKKPIAHKPGQGVTTDEDGKPIDGVEGVSDFPEGSTGKPGTDDQQIFYDEHGRPYKKPIAHKPGQGVTTDEDGKPIDGVEGVTDFPPRVTEKPGSQDQEIFYDDHGRPHKKPVTHKKPGPDEEDVLPDEHGTPIDGVTKSPEGDVDELEHDGITESMIGYGHTGKPDIKPGQFIPGPEGVLITEEVGSMTKLPESFTGKPESTSSHSAESESPEVAPGTYEHEKPSGGGTKPSHGQMLEVDDKTSEAHGEHDDIDLPQSSSQEHDQPEEEDDTHPLFDDQKPSHGEPGGTDDDEETGFKPSKRPATQEIESIESTTKLSSDNVHDVKVPSSYDGQTPVHHESEENDISGDPEKDVTGVDDDSVTKPPEIAVDADELLRPQKKPIVTDHDSEDLLHHYPHQQPVPSKTPDGHLPNVNDDTTTEEDDESLIITTDESEEDMTEMPQVLDGVHKKPESAAEEKPLDTKTKIPSHVVPGHAQQGPTPGLDSQSDDFTTPVYGSDTANEISFNEKGGVAHVTTGKPEEHVPGMSIEYDEDSKPNDVTTPKEILEALSPTDGQAVTDEDHAKPASGDKDPILTGSTPISEDDGDESRVPEKDSNQAGISDTEVGHGDTHQDPSPTHDTDGVTSLDASVLPGVVKPMSTPEGTHGVPESTGSVPSGEIHTIISSTMETPGKVSQTKPAPHQPPHIFIPYLPPDDGSSTNLPILIDEGLHESSGPFDDVLNNLANILRPTQTTEEPVGTTEDHGEVPGEGSCFMDGVTYQHNADVPPLSPCHTKCTCISSIIHCLSLKCPPPPEDVSNCTVVHEENTCCPIYVCGTDVTPTFPFENHEKETTTEISTDKDESPTIHDYEPSKPTKPLAGVTPQEPELTGSDDSGHTDEDMPIKHETDEKTPQGSEPGVVSESEKPQFGSEVPEESDKGTALTEKPEEDSVDETHTSQGVDHVTSSKPESTGIETSTESKIPTKISEDDVTPDTSHVGPEEQQSGYLHQPSFGNNHPSTNLPVYFGTEKPALPHQSHHKPESGDHVLDTDKLDQEETKEPASVAESVKPHDDKQKPAEVEGSVPDDFAEATTYKPLHHETTKPTDSTGLSQDDKTPDKVAAGEGESLKPEEPQKETESGEVHEHDETETDVHSTLEQEPVKKPVEKPDEITLNKGKPQSGQEPEATELEHQTTERPGEKEPQIHEGSTSEDEEIAHTTSRPPEKPEMDVKPAFLDETSGHTATEPSGESPVTEGSYNKPQSTDEEAEHSQKPELHLEPTIPDQSGESDASIKKPVTHDKPSEEGEKNEQMSPVDADRLPEVSQTIKPGQSISTGTMPTEEDSVSTDKTYGGAQRPTYDTIAGDQKPYKKPEDSTMQPDETYTTSQPIDQSESGKPHVSPEETTDVHKKPLPGHDGGHETFVTSEGPHEEFATEIYPSPVSEDSSLVTVGPHEETSEEFEDTHDKHPSVHPTSMDNESAVTTEEPSSNDKKPQGKPGTDAYPTLTDEKSSTMKPDEEPTKVEQSPIKPESEEGLVVKPTEEGSVVKKPTVSEKPVFGEKVPQGEQETDFVHSTTESQMIDGKPGEIKPQHAQHFSSTVRPKPTGVDGVSGQGKPQTDDIPEEVLLHPTRMPGTYETEGPDHIPDVEEDDDRPSQGPHTENESVATIFPEGIIRPITKRPIYGTSKPVVSDNKESTTPGYPFIQFGPHTIQGTNKPVHTSEVTAKPVFDIMTDVPEDFAQLFGIKPPTVHGEQPDKYDKPEHSTHFVVPDLTTRVPDFKPQTMDHIKRPIHSTNGTHFIQYVPYKEGEVPLVPEGATLGELLERPDGEKYWPVIYMKVVTTTPGAETPQRPFKPIPQQVFNGTHFIQYVPYDDDKEPEVPVGAELGQPQKGPDGQIYWPIIGKKPIMTSEDKPITEQPYPGQIYNGTHFIQYVPFEEGQKPEPPENATLGELVNAPNGQKFWPIISNSPIPEDESVTSQRPFQSQPEQIFNGTHFIQFAPYNDGQEPEIPEEATLGQPQKGPDGQIYWPIIDTKPLPVIPEKLEPATEQPSESLHAFNGTNFIQYVPVKDGVLPEVPEGATLGQPQKGPGGQIYWPIIYMKPQPVTPQGSFPEQVYNGTHFIQYVPYKDGYKPEVPSDVTLGEPQKAPDGQMYWPIIYTKPVTAKPEDEMTTERPSQAPVFNGTHFIQYVPHMEGFEPDIPEEATLGKPEKKPDGEMYWPIIYQKLPTRPKPETVQHYPGQFFNGTHFVQYLPYRPSHKPHVPEGVTVSQPQKGPDGQMYWMIVSTKPLPTVLEEPVGPQYFNGTHFIQYIPYEKEKEPEVPEEATVGKPEIGTAGQKFWPIIYMKPLPGVPITYQKPFYQEQGTPSDLYKGQVFNGTHYIQYVPYVPGKTPDIPPSGVLGHLTKRPDGQMYWPIIFQRPLPGVPVSYDETQTFDPIKGPVFNGTHYVQYVPYKPGERPILPEGATLGQPTTRPNGQLYWPIYYLRPVQGSPTQGPMLWSPYDYIKPQPEHVYNGTHFIQYLPYNPTRMPEVPEGATLGQPQKGPGGQMYWVIISDKPLPAQAFNDTHVVQYVTPVTPEQDKEQIDQNKPIQVFNGSHYIQYVPYIPGQKPVLPEGASLGQPTKGPEGQMYWPIIYMKPQSGKPNQQVPIFWGPGHDHLEPTDQQIFNGTHYIRFIKYDPTMKPIAPEGATISQPQRRPDGQLYWVIASKKPLLDMQVPVQQQPGQIFNGTHYIQYVPYNSSQMPQVPEGAVLGHPQKGPEGQMYWVIISDKPLPAQPGTQYVQYVTPVTPEDDQMVPGPMFNGTHYIQYVPYKPAQVPKVPQDAILGELHKGPGGQMYWPIIYRRPPQSFNGTHHIQYVPDNGPGADVSKPSMGMHHLQPVNATSKPTEDHPFWSYGQYAPRPGNGTLPSVNKFPSQKPGTEEHAFWTYGHDKPQNGSQDKYGYKPTTEYPSWSSGQIHNATKVPELPKLPSGQYGGSDHAKPGYGYESGYYKPEKPERPSTSDDSYEAIDEDHLIEYPSGSDYDETQEQPYGPGTCRYAGKVYVSAQQIPRDDPCDFCFCFRSDIICLQQSCPPPIPGCHEEPIQGFCCPRYECHVRMATLLNVTSTTTTTTTTLPPHFLSHVYKGAAGRTGCFIQGKAYRVGQAIPSASGPCMDCMCGGDGKMKCEPKVCTPEPMVRQMMVSSEKPTTANHR